MSLLVFGMSHHRADAAWLERVTLDEDARAKLASTLLLDASINEAMVLSTCNRTEVYADVSTFHGAIDALAESFSTMTGASVDDLAEVTYVRYEDQAIAHAFSVAAGLDSMAVGEAQILGQFRDALTQAQAAEVVGPALNTLAQHALRVGKRVHTDTDIDQVAGSLVEAALDLSETTAPAATSQALVVGAGGMAALAATTLVRRNYQRVTVVNRTPEKAAALAERIGGHARDLDELEHSVAEADVVIACTGAAGVIVTAQMVRAAMTQRRERPLVLIDLALPHDIDLAVTDIEQVRRIGLDELASALSDTPDTDADAAAPAAVVSARDLIAAEVAEFLTQRNMDAVAPTVAALRARANEVVEAELARLTNRATLSDADRAEVAKTVHRIVEKLLHAPTVRAKERAGDGSGAEYARLLSDLFALDAQQTANVSAAPTRRGGIDALEGP